MRTIYKYQLKLEDEQELILPKGAVILCVQVQNMHPYIWAQIDTEAPVNDRRTIYTYGTGNPMREIERFDPTEDRYIGTYHLHGGAYVFHVFEQALREDYLSDET